MKWAQDKELEGNLMCLLVVILINSFEESYNVMVEDISGYWHSWGTKRRIFSEMKYNRGINKKRLPSRTCFLRIVFYFWGKNSKVSILVSLNSQTTDLVEAISANYSQESWDSYHFFKLVSKVVIYEHLEVCFWKKKNGYLKCKAVQNFSLERI